MAAAVVVSLLMGVSMVVSRILNARLARATSLFTGTAINYITGLSVSLLVMLLFGAHLRWQPVPPGRWWIYCGGLMGAALVMVSNWITIRISAMYQTLLLFVGQAFAGVAIDTVLKGEFSPGILAGGILAGAGLLICLWVDSRPEKEKGGKDARRAG